MSEQGATVTELPASPSPSALHVPTVEAAYLAALMNGASLQEALAGPADIGDPLHKLILEAILAVSARFRAADRASVRAELETRQASAKVLQACDVVAYMDHRLELVPSYVAQIQEAAARRRAVVLADEVRRAATDGRTRLDVALRGPAHELGTLGFVGKEPAPDQDIRDLEADIIETCDALEKGEPAPRNHLLLPFDCWNNDPEGLKGLPCKRRACNVTILAARAGIGKTTLIATLIHHYVIGQKRRIGVVGLEDGTRWLLSRLMASVFRLDWQQMEDRLPDMLRNAARWENTRGVHPETGALLDIPSALEYFRGLYNERIRRWAAPIRAPELVALLKRWRDEGVELAFVDHGLRVNYDVPKGERLDRVIGETWDKIADLSMGGMSVLAAWHLNRTQQDGTPPTMGDLKESGQVDGLASLMLGSWKDPHTGKRLLNVPKSRGCGGDGHIIDLHQLGRTGLLDCLASQRVNLSDLKAEAREKSKGVKL